MDILSHFRAFSTNSFYNESLTQRYKWHARDISTMRAEKIIIIIIGDSSAHTQNEWESKEECMCVPCMFKARICIGHASNENENGKATVKLREENRLLIENCEIHAAK